MISRLRKHAHAANATVSLREGDGGYFALVSDDGVGFAAETQQATPGHLGLASMRERADDFDSTERDMEREDGTPALRRAERRVRGPR